MTLPNDDSPRNGPMTLTRAVEIQDVFEAETSYLALPICSGDGFDFLITGDYLEDLLIAAGVLDPRDEDEDDDDDDLDDDDLDDDDEDWS
jgi:hypothetical protein